MIKNTRLKKKLKYIKIDRKDYYRLIKKLSLLTKNNKILEDENRNYKEINNDLKNRLDNVNKSMPVYHKNTPQLENKGYYKFIEEDIEEVLYEEKSESEHSKKLRSLENSNN